ncbi:hypothetical protein R9X47_07045 [Wukongibacter baidiensis]|uniref:hypothetical protein n=1 Tax=Wukongibacter baidiensis TaxID=1723361 RepID=UPI003D7F54F2
MGCCGGGHNNHSQIRGTKTHDRNHNREECTNNYSSKMMIIFGLIVLGGLAYYFLR